MIRPSTNENNQDCPGTIMRIHSKRIAIFVSIVLLSCQGCGSDNPATIPVVGQVTFNEGPMPGPGTIYFVPSPGNGPTTESMRPAIARFDQSGKFKASTWEQGDGLRPGKYLVTIECWKQSPTMSHQGTSYVDLKFLKRDESELSLEVNPSDRKCEVNWNVTGPANPIDLGGSALGNNSMQMETE